MENYAGSGYIIPNWNPGTTKSTEPSFIEKIENIVKHISVAKSEFNLNDGDVLLISSPSNHMNQTYLEKFPECEGLFASKKVEKIARLSTCLKFAPGYQKTKYPIKANRSHVFLFHENNLIPLFKESGDWLKESNVVAAVEKVLWIRKNSFSKVPNIVELELSTPRGSIKHLAWSFETSKSKKLYCLFDSGYIFEADSREVSEMKIENGRKNDVVHSEFARYKMLCEGKNRVFGLYDLGDKSDNAEPQIPRIS
ncbi:MAG: hypothetical protein ACK5N8_05320 [Alphaproteobacteria bacterium]